MSSPFGGLDWPAIMSPNVQPNVPFELPSSTTDLHPLTSPGASRHETLSNSIYKFQVCSSCRRKKRKCTLERPSCSLCLEHGWICEYRHVKKKPGPPKRSGGTVAAASPVMAAGVEMTALTNTTSYSAAPSLPAISDYAKKTLVDLYFVHVQPILPLFCRSYLERDLAEDKIPNKLLYAFYTVTSRFAPLEEILVLLGPSDITPWKNFARIADLESQAQDCDAPLTLNDVKADVLLTLYQFINIPGRKAWLMVGTLMRTALGFGLHRIDCGRRETNLTEFELEEQRFVWWAVWKLDSAINSSTGSHFGIDSNSIGTALVSISVAEFTAGSLVNSNSQFLPTDSSRSWTNAQEILAKDTEDGTNMHLLSICFVRAVMLCRQSLHANTTPELIRQFMVLRNALPCMRLSLPEWYFDPSMQTWDTAGSHRARLETLLLMHMSHVQ